LKTVIAKSGQMLKHWVHPMQSSSLTGHSSIGALSSNTFFGHTMTHSHRIYTTWYPQTQKNSPKKSPPHSPPHGSECHYGNLLTFNITLTMPLLNRLRKSQGNTKNVSEVSAYNLAKLIHGMSVTSTAFL